MKGHAPHLPKNILLIDKTIARNPMHKHNQSFDNKNAKYLCLYAPHGN